VEHITLMQTASIVDATEKQVEEHPSEVRGAKLGSPHEINDQNMDANHDEDAPP
jgi:hypothetical protein